jgi:hypothetical protein
MQALPKDKEYAKPGRQMTVFFFMFNAALWLIFTFEIQKVETTLIKSQLTKLYKIHKYCSAGEAAWCNHFGAGSKVVFLTWHHIY